MASRLKAHHTDEIEKKLDDGYTDDLYKDCRALLDEVKALSADLAKARDALDRIGYRECGCGAWKEARENLEGGTNA
jgi:hypothetical protein